MSLGNISIRSVLSHVGRCCETVTAQAPGVRRLKSPPVGAGSPRPYNTGRPPAWTLPRRLRRRSPGAKARNPDCGPLRRGFNRPSEQVREKSNSGPFIVRPSLMLQFQGCRHCFLASPPLWSNICWLILPYHIRCRPQGLDLAAIQPQRPLAHLWQAFHWPGSACSRLSKKARKRLKSVGYTRSNDRALRYASARRSASKRTR